MLVGSFRSRWMVAAVAWGVLATPGCDSPEGESDSSVWGCDPSREVCGDTPSPDAASEPDDDDADSAAPCEGDDCSDDDTGDPGEPGDPGDPGDDSPSGDDPRGCDAQYEVCLESGVPEAACAVVRDQCDDDRGDVPGTSGDPMCSDDELAGGGGDAEDPLGGFGCYDGIDGDCDQLVDCEDPDCALFCGQGGGGGDGDHCGSSPPDECYGCSCVPGVERDCHVPGPCTWGKSTCDADGTWGACLDTNEIPPSCGGGVGTAYDAACCVESGRCCENLDYDYDVYDSTVGPHGSVGNCDAVCTPSSGT